MEKTCRVVEDCLFALELAVYDSVPSQVTAEHPRSLIDGFIA